MSAPERIYADRGPKGGWMFREERMPDTVAEYARADLLATSQRELAEARAERDEARANHEYFAIQWDERGYVLKASDRRIEALEKKLQRCNWYWPEDDTSSEMCGESAQEIVQNAYDWTPEESGEVVAIARGGIVEVTYCASLPPADDADSDDDFWVQEETHEAAQARIDAEKARRAILNPSEKNNG